MVKTEYKDKSTDKLKIMLDKAYDKVCEECRDSGLISNIVEMELELESRCGE